MSAPTIGAIRNTHSSSVYLETTAGPNWRAGFKLPPVEVPSRAIPSPIRMPTTQGTSGASRGLDKQYPTAKTINPMPMASTANNGAADQKGAGRMTAYNTGGCSTTGPQSARAATTPTTEPAN